LHLGAYDYALIFKTKYEVVEGDIENLLPGVSVIATPGHEVKIFDHAKYPYK